MPSASKVLRAGKSARKAPETKTEGAGSRKTGARSVRWVRSRATKVTPCFWRSETSSLLSGVLG